MLLTIAVAHERTLVTGSKSSSSKQTHYLKIARGIEPGLLSKSGGRRKRMRCCFLLKREVKHAHGHVVPAIKRKLNHINDVKDLDLSGIG